MPNVSLNGIEFSIKGSSDAASDSVKSLTKQLDKLNASLAHTKVGNLSGQMKQVGAAAKQASSKTSQFFASIVRIAKYRLIRSALKAITSAFAEGLKNAYQFSKGIGGDLAASLDLLSTKSLTMKNQLGAAFGGLITALTPILVQVVSIVNAIAAAITRLIAIIGGKSTWTRAKDVWQEWGEAAGGAGGAAKEALKYLAPFDELNRLPDENKGGGGGGANTPDFSDMFEEVPVDVTAGLLDTLTDALSQLGDWFESKDWIDIGTKAFETLQNIFSDTGKMSELVSAFFETLGAAFGAVVGFAWGFLKTAAEDVIKTFKENIVDYNGDGKISFSEFLTAVWKTATSPIKWIDENIVKPFWRGFTETLFGEAQDPITVDEFMDWVFGHLSDQAIMAWVREKAVPWIQDGINEVIDEISIFFTGMDASTLSQWLDNWGELFKGWLADLPAKFKQAGINAINALAEPFTDGINGIIEKLNNSGLASALGIELDPIEFKLIPDIPEEELNKHYNEAKAKIEAESAKKPAGLSAAITSATDEIETKPEIAAKALFTSFKKSFSKSSSSTTSKGTPIITSQAKMTSFTRNFSKNTTSGGSPIFNSQAKFTSRVFGDKFSTVFGSEAYFTNFSIKAAIQAKNGALRVPTEAVIVSTSGQGKITMETKAEGGVLSGGLWRSLPKYAGGTARAHGTLFAAGEAGPEVVGHIGGRTEVLNRSQLAATMYSAVRSAMAGTGFRVMGGPSIGGATGEADNEEAMYRAMVRALNEANIGPEEITLDGDVVYRNVLAKNKQMKKAYGFNPMLTT